MDDGRRCAVGPLIVDDGGSMFVIGERAAAGAAPGVADRLDRTVLTTAVAKAARDVIVRRLTALSGRFDRRRIDHTFPATNQLRTEGTDIPLAAAEADTRKERG